jgi:nucleotide-binding universal stress UspA family protein
MAKIGADFSKLVPGIAIAAILKQRQHGAILTPAPELAVPQRVFKSTKNCHNETIGGMMQNVKKLLVPVDFSAESEKALQYASSLAKQINAELIALYVVEDILNEGILAYIFPPDGWPYMDVQPSVRPLDVLLRERALDLWRFIERTVHDNGSTKIKRMVRLGKVREEIAAVAREENIDLVVLEFRKRFLFPSRRTRKLFKMIDKLPYPVLLPPPIAEDTPGRGKPIFAFHRSPAENPI